VKSGEQIIRDEMKTADAISTVSFLIPGLDRTSAWAYVADTDSLNQLLGNPSLNVSYDNNTPGGSVRTMTTRDEMGLVYDEEFYQWDEDNWLGIRRSFHSGVFEKMLFLFRLEEGNELSLAITSASWARDKDSLPTVTDVINNKMPEMLSPMASHLENGHNLDVPRYDLPTVDIPQKKIDAARNALLTLGESSSTVEHFIGEISTAQDHELV